MRWMNECAAPAHYDLVKFIQYPPFDFALAAPLTVLPLISSYAVWTLATMLAGLGGLLYLRRVSGKSMTMIEVGSVTLLYAGSLFSFNSIILGQTAWLLLAVVCIFFAALLENRQILCGLAIALSTIKPQLLMLLAPPLLIRKMWVSIAVAGALELILLGLSVGTVGWDNVIKYPQILVHAESDLFGRDNERMVSVRGLTSILFGGSGGFLVSVISVVVAVALMCWVWWKADARPSQFRAISISTLVFLIFSPHSFLYDCLLLAIPTVLLLAETTLSGALLDQSVSRKIWGVSLMLTPSLLLVPYFFLHPETWASLLLLALNIALLISWLKTDPVV
jgi:hypothetical protein